MPLRYAVAGLLVVSLVSGVAGLGFWSQLGHTREAPRARAEAYTAWQYQAEKKRYWCQYRYTNSAGQAAYQFVLYYPDEQRSNVYYFQTPAGRVWACCTRPGAPGYTPEVMKWFRQDSSGKWVRRSDGECPTPPDGGRRIGAAGDSPLPIPPPPEGFAKLSAADRRLAEEFHRLLAEVTIEDGRIVALDFGSAQVTDAVLQKIGKVESLQRLYLTGTQITDAGLKHLAGLEKLTHLDLSQTLISDEGMKHLGELKSLRTLIVRGSHGVSAEGVRTARKSNPKLLVTGP